MCNLKPLSLQRNVVLSLTAAILLGLNTAAVAHRIAHHFAPREFAYAIAGTRIYHYSVTATGSLKPLTPATVLVKPVPPHTAPGQLILHPTRPFAFIQCGDRLLQYRINPNGQMSRLQASPVPLTGSYADLVMDPRGRFLYVVEEGAALGVYRVGGNGRLYHQPDTRVERTYTQDERWSRMGGYEAGLITIDPAGRYLYAYAVYHFADHTDGELIRY